MMQVKQMGISKNWHFISMATPTMAPPMNMLPESPWKILAG